MFLSALRFNVENELEPILLQLVTFLKARERDLVEDDLINDLYKHLFNVNKQEVVTSISGGSMSQGQIIISSSFP